MNDMVNYIFKVLNTHEQALEISNRFFKTQSKFNAGVTVFAMTTTVCLILSEQRIRSLEKEIRRLKEIKGE